MQWMTHCQDEIMPGIWWLRSSSWGFLSDEALLVLKILGSCGAAPLSFQILQTWRPVPLSYYSVTGDHSFSQGGEGIIVILCCELSHSKGR